MEKSKDLESITLEDAKNKIIELQNKIDEQSKQIEIAKITLQEGNECNSKLAYCTRLFAEVHMTIEEKVSIAQEFDRAMSQEQVERIYKKYYTQIRPEGAEIEDDCVWSPGFIRDLEKYYFHYKGYNPFAIIDSSIQNIRNQFLIEDEIGNSDSPAKIEDLRSRWETNRMLSLKGIDDIVSTINDFMGKN